MSELLPITIEAEAPATGRFTILTPNRKATFLEKLALFGNVRLSCKAAGVSPQTAYRARRQSPAFARAWDAALLSARTHAEQELADRAINGVEEAVYYHGEEIARRRRYDARLLLAHLARLDRLAERADVAEALPLLDDQIEALKRGEDFPEEPCGGLSPHVLRHARDERGALDTCAGPQKESQDPVPCVPSCRVSPPSHSAAVRRTETPSSRAVGQTTTPSGSETEEPDGEIPEMERRLQRMEAARPPGVLLPHQLATATCDPGAIEAAQLDAFEAGEGEWWLVTPSSSAAIGQTETPPSSAAMGQTETP